MTETDKTTSGSHAPAPRGGDASGTGDAVEPGAPAEGLQRAGAQPPESADHADAHRAHLGRSLAHGVAWMGSAKWMSQLFTWVSTIVVARLLTPEDYGLVGLATLFLGVVTLFSEFGIGTTVVTLRNLSDEQLAEVNTLALLLGLGGFALSCAVAPLLARYFDAPNLTLVVIAMACNFIISATGVVPRAMLQRELRFRDLALNDGLQALTLAVGAVTFAVLGFRYWTLVLSAVLGTSFAAIAARRLVPVKYRWPRWEALAPAVRFSRQTIVGRLSWYVYSNADFFVAGKLLGKDALGAYRFAWDLANAPGEKVTSLVGGVTPGILSAAQHDPAALRRIALRVTEALSLITLPACIGLALVANNLVPLVLGEKWLVMVAPLQILGLAAALRSVTPILPQILVVIGRNRDMMRVNLLGAVVMPLAFLFGSRWGTTGIAIGWLTAYPLCVALPMAWLALRSIALPPLTYLRAFSASGTGIAVMTLAVLAARQLQPVDAGRLASLMLDVAVGALSYTSSLFLFHRASVMALVQRVRKGLGR